MMRLVLAVALAGAAAMAQAGGPDDYAIVLPLATSGDSAAWRIELPLQVHAWSQDELLRDVAVFDADGRAVPLAEWIPFAAMPAGRQYVLSRPLELPASRADGPLRDDLHLLVERDADGRLRLGAKPESRASLPARAWLLDVAAVTEGVDQLSLDWAHPRDGVFARFAVDASDDLQGWRQLRADATVAMLQQAGARIERRTIALDGSRAHYLRLRRLDDGAPLDGLVVHVEHLARSAHQREPVQWVPAEIVAMHDAGTTIDYRLPARLSIEALRIELADDNSAAEIAVSAITGMRDGQPVLQSLLRVTAYRLRDRESIIDQGESAISRTPRIAQLRLATTRALANAPRVQVGWRAPSLVFLAEGRAPYVLAAGHASARRAAASLDAPLAVLRARHGVAWQPPLATTGALRVAAGQAALESATATTWRSLLLWAVLLAAAALVALFALKLLRGRD